MTRTLSHVLATAVIGTVSLAACQPYESRTVEIGERGIRPVLMQPEMADATTSTPAYAPPPPTRFDRRDELLRARDELERRGAIMPSHELPEGWDDAPGAQQPESRRGGGLRPGVGEPGGGARGSPEFDECVARYRRHKTVVDQYGGKAPSHVMVRERSGQAPRRVSCSQINFYARLGGDRGEVYRRYQSECTPLRASGPIYDAAKKRVDETQQECFSIARRAGILPGEARSRLR